METISELKKHTGHNFDVMKFHQYMISNDYSDVDNLVKNCKLDSTGQRFNLWRLFFKIYEKTDSVFEKIEKLKTQRNQYSDLQNKHLKRQEDPKPTSGGPLGGPLAGPLGNQKAKAVTQIDNAELKNEIKKDVERTYQEFEFFKHKKIIHILTNVLFIWSKENSEISYRQGMNEVAASLIYVYFREALYKEQVDKYEEATDEDKELLLLFNSWEFAEADIYSLVHMLMNEAQHMEMFRPNYTEQQKIKLQSKKASAILTRVAKLQDILLKKVDLELFRHLKLLQVEFQIFLLKWIRCMFTRELHLIESFNIWDAIFFDYNKSESDTLFFVDCIALAMIIFIKPQLMKNEESSQCYQKFLKYAQITDLPELVEAANKINTILLSSKSSNNLDENESNEKNAENLINPIVFRQVETNTQNTNINVTSKQLKNEEKKVQAENETQEKVVEQKAQPQTQIQQNSYFDSSATTQSESKVIKAQLSVDEPKTQDSKCKKESKTQEQSIKIPLQMAHNFYSTIDQAFNFIKQSEDSQNHQELIISLAELKQYLNHEIKQIEIVSDGGFVIKKTISDQHLPQDNGLKSKMANMFKKKW